ncbi:MAG TPA: hypothetical protein VFM98_21165 [Ramlibacter sp.]|uniref:hypothetical protein n=1 Tax=Ramlibacter sp. TaxID=1917967 RepID=UPI002D800E1A|nr:hypothetical protein [Ramlibacter sp.]HET8748121.1 hypothetical protein [Ramlibacter sp.]
MYFFILLGCTLALLTMVALVDGARRNARVRVAFAAAGPSPAPVDPIHDRVARLLKGPKEDKPCLTPVDCVQENRCAGLCGCH